MLVLLCTYAIHTGSVQAIRHNYRVEIMEAKTPWAFNPDELARRNEHGVSRGKVSGTVQWLQLVDDERKATGRWDTDKSMTMLMLTCVMARASYGVVLITTPRIGAL